MLGDRGDSGKAPVREMGGLDMEPLVTVLTGVRNGERYIGLAVESMLGQTFRGFEYIIVDDCSNDGTAEILDRYSRLDSRVRVIHSVKRLGFGGTKNRGIEIARGEYVALMDGDDVSRPERLERQVQYMQAHPGCVILGTHYCLIDGDGAVLKQAVLPLDHAGIERELLRGIGTVIAQPSAMLRMSALRAIGGYREDVGCTDDLDVYLRLLGSGDFANLPDCLFDWRQHWSSHTALSDREKRREWLELRTSLVTEAARRRGLDPAGVILADFPLIESASQWHTDWAWALFNRGNVSLARKHALRALVADMRRFDAWQVLLYSLLGRGAGDLARRAYRRLFRRGK
jgi:glycosyltransferase involved in cell wall biosynthesis